MRSRFAFGVALLALVLSFVCFGALVATADEPLVEQAPAGTVDTAAVLRRGDRVERIGGPTPGGSWEASPESVIEQAIEATPADDRDKWFVSVVTLPTCPPCKSLLEAWSNPSGVPEETLPMGSRYLRAIARPEGDGWAHFLQYNAGDLSQKERFGKVKLGPLPRVLVQSPLSGKYGPSKDVVFLGSPFDPEYGGDLEKFAEAILAAIRGRVATFAPEEFAEEEKKPAPKRLGLDPVRIPVKVEGTNNLGPQPFKHDGAEAVFPIFPRDEADQAPSDGFLAKHLKSGGDWAIGLAYQWLDEKVGGWLELILSLLGVLMLGPKAGPLLGWIWWAVKAWFNLGKAKPADQVDPDQADGPNLWARLQAALAALLAKAPETSPAKRTTRKATATRRKR